MSTSASSFRLPSDPSVVNDIFSDNSESNTDFQEAKNKSKRFFCQFSGGKKS